MKVILGNILLLALVWGTTGCDKLKSAVNASARVAAQVENLAVQTEASYDAQLIDKATALKIAVIIRDHLNPAVKSYTEFVATLAKDYPKGKDADGNKIPASLWAQANALFNAVEKPFRDILVLYGALTPEQSALIKVAIVAIQETLAVIRSGFQFAQGEPKWTSA